MNPRSTVQIAGHPVHVMLVPFVIAFYIAGFAADLAFAETFDPFFPRAALWAIGLGVLFSAAAAAIGLIDFLFEPLIRDLSAAWWHLGGNVLMSLISILDLVLRWEVGAEAGSRAYIWLSLAAVVLLFFNGWMGGQLVYRHKVGVAD
jgi:uncharacterized membrane protein